MNYYYYKNSIFFLYNPFKNTFARPEAGYKSHFNMKNIQNSGFSVSYKVSTMQQAVQSIKKQQFLLSASSQSATIKSFNLLILKQTRVLRDTKIFFNWGDSRKPSQNDIK